MIIKSLPPKKYIEMFNENYEIIQSDNYFFAIMSNDFDDFKQFSYINGLNICQGGTHVEYIINEVVSRLRNNLSKKYKDIKPGDIRNKLMLVSVLRDFKNLKFNSQTKEHVTNSITEVKQYFGDIDFDALSKKILRNTNIMDPITEVYKIKEEFKLRQELKNAEKPEKKKPKDEKFLSPIGEWNRIYLAEGDSARNSISKILGRQGNGFFAMFGVPPNAYDMDMKDIIKSDKLKSLQNILGLKFSQNEQDNINFNEIIIATDADLPGFFIRGQLLGLFVRFGKNLFKENKIKIFRSPVIVGYDNKENIKEWFYDAEDLQEYEKKNPNTKLTFAWKKGLGSWDQAELEYIIEKEGIDKMLETMVLDDDAEKNIDNWLGGKNADIRKEMLDGFEFSITNL
ncbi:MAG: toprim domain-containing protein [Bacilli bacterium]|nr:toprim domain-containing protein [Bacilli bacterium]